MKTNKRISSSSSWMVGTRITVFGSLFFGAVLLLILIQINQPSSSNTGQRQTSSSSIIRDDTTTDDEVLLKKNKPITPLRTRNDLASVLESEGFTTGVELGVFKGDFARVS